MECSRRASGFTLIELLVVIAIIAVLAAILFPVFTTAKQTALRTACLSNMSQLGKGLMLYAQDNGERIPSWAMVRGQNRWNMPAAVWWDQIFPYVKNFQLYVCPARPKDGLYAYGSVDRPAGYGISQYTWGYTAGDPAKVIGPRLSEIPSSSKVILVGEVGSDRVIGIAYMASVTEPYVAKVHGKKVNWIFADGHARTLSCTETIVPRLMWNLKNRYPWAADSVYLNSEKEAQDYIMDKYPILR